MLRLAYMSSARKLMSKEELLALLDSARKKNAQLGLTGLLLYKDGNILQVLEGEDQVVRDLFKVISRDQRHSDVFTIIEEPIQARLFAGWEMGFRDLDDPALQSLPGFSRLMNVQLDRPGWDHDPSGVLGLIEMFCNGR